MTLFRVKTQLLGIILSSLIGINKTSARRYSTKINVGLFNETYPVYSSSFSHREFLHESFPSGFEWGAATSAYQIEGAWNTDGKGPSIWDEFVRRIPTPILDGSTGNIACDSYHKFPVDVRLLKRLGVDFYRFSLSWARVLPDGKLASKNQRGIDYYNNLIDLLLENGIQPVVTLYHWDLPAALESIGGWLNVDLILYFADYAYFAFDTFGDRVKTWITFNEAGNFCTFGYADGTFAPGIRDAAEKPYICGHTILKAHALAYRIYETVFKPAQKGRCGMTLHTSWFEPGTTKKNDIAAAERAIQFEFGWFAAPLFFGNYPKVMRELIGKKSETEGLTESRLPKFDKQWQMSLKGSYDFLGLNHYTTELVKDQKGATPGWYQDQDTFTYQDPNWEGSGSPWLKVVPWGFRKLLNWIKNTYNNPLVLVTENGVSGPSSETTHDPSRIHYFKEYINNMLKAVVLDGCNVRAYTFWSLEDNFEWNAGYTQRFGLHYVDFTVQNRTRKQKASVHSLRKIISQNGFA